MMVPGFSSEIAAELEALHAECEASKHIEDIVTRETIAYTKVRGTPKAPHQYLRMKIAAGYADRRQRSAA